MKSAITVSVALFLLCSYQMQEIETPYEEDFSGKPEPREVVITTIYIEATRADAMTVAFPDGMTVADVIRPMP